MPPKKASKKSSRKTSKKQTSRKTAGAVVLLANIIPKSLSRETNQVYGIFSAINTPKKENFPCGVIYQRNANWTKNTLLDVDNTKPLQSILSSSNWLAKMINSKPQ